MAETKEARKSDIKETGLTTQKQATSEVINAGASLFFDVAKFELAQRVAKIFAGSTMVPEQFKNNIGNCVIAINLADRMNADPFMLMQNMYIIKGKPSIEAKLAIALVNNSGKFTALQYRYNKDKTACYAYAKRIDTGEECKGVTVSMKMAKDEGWYGKTGSKWKTMPELMLMYRAAMFFARAYCPEALFGMQSKEELYDIVDMNKAVDGQYKSPEEKLAADVTAHANQEPIDIKPEPETPAEPKAEPTPKTTARSEDADEIGPEEAAEIEAAEIEAAKTEGGRPGF